MMGVMLILAIQATLRSTISRQKGFSRQQKPKQIYMYVYSIKTYGIKLILAITINNDQQKKQNKQLTIFVVTVYSATMPHFQT